MIKIVLAILMVMGSSITSAKNILVVGDSLSAGYGINAEQGWVALLQHKLQAENKSFQVFNESISGDTTAGGLARIDSALSKHRPDILLLELGANDGLRGLSPNIMQANLTEIIKRSQKAGAKVLLLGIRIPLNYGKRYSDMFYTVYPTLAKNLKVSLVPFMLEDVALNKNFMQADGLHPNAEAQPVLLETIWSNLMPLVK
ncbi:MAG: arylesterase [Methylococcales bacterium]